MGLGVGAKMGKGGGAVGEEGKRKKEGLQVQMQGP